MRYVKFSPSEMAYEAPEDVSDPKRFPTLAKGRAEWREFLSFKRGYVKIDPDIREFFRDDRAINEVLRRALQMMQVPVKRRKIA